MPSPGNPFPRLSGVVESFNPITSPAIDIVGLGSSIGLGGGLMNPDTEAPLPVFVAAMKKYFNRLGEYTLVAQNYATNGSVIVDGVNTQYPAAVAAGHPGKVVLVVFGMNDGRTTSYNAGETFTNYAAQIKLLVAAIRAQGADPIFCTTPHPHSVRTGTNMPGATNQIYPTAITAPVSDSALQPSVVASLQSTDWEGNITPISYRHWRFNEVVRATCGRLGVGVIDVERYWLNAVGERGEDALFSGSETVHPNLLGYTLSYRKAIEEYVREVWTGLITSVAPVDVGSEVTASGKQDNTAGPVMIDVPDNCGGEITVIGVQSGVGKATYLLPFTKYGGVLAVGTPDKSFVSGDPLTGITAASGQASVACLAANTNVRWFIRGAPFN